MRPMRRCGFLVALSLLVAACLLVFPGRSAESATCRSGSVRAVVGGKTVCLKAGQRCVRGLDRRYHRYRFHCHAGRLTRFKPKARPPRDVRVVVTGEPEVVFDWTTDRCDDEDIPDLAARVFRDADGNVQLISSQFVSRRFIGPDLDHIRRECDVIMQSGLDPDPAAFDDHEWLASTWTPDGRIVYALVHDEYQGHSRPERCPSGNYFSCWYNAITLAVSHDGGRSYRGAPRPNLVASIPYPYVPDTGPRGMFAPSNIVRGADGFLYAFPWLGFGNDGSGTCLMRTKNPADPSSWRGWSGGRRFEMTFVDPYGPNPRPEEHLCKRISGDPGTVTYNSVARQWIYVVAKVGGFYYALSPDLITWTKERRFDELTTTWEYQCGDPDPVLYPSLVDPSSTSRNFETSDGRAYVYYTVLHYPDCQQTLDRDLVRVPVTIRP
jgi:hypothetical protein